jgi:hypothetical protein
LWEKLHRDFENRFDEWLKREQFERYDEDDGSDLRVFRNQFIVVDMRNQKERPWDALSDFVDKYQP